MRSPGARLSDQTRTRSDSDNSTCPTQPFIPLAAKAAIPRASLPSLSTFPRPWRDPFFLFGRNHRLARVAVKRDRSQVAGTGRKGTMLEHVLCPAWLEEMLHDCIDPDRLGD